MTTKGKRRKRRRRQASDQRPQPQQSAVAVDDQQRAVARRRASPGERPEAPWGSFPLSELVVLIALILLVVGFITGAAVTLGVGLGLGALAGVELAAREHFAGYRSHNVLLAGAAGMTVFGLLFVLTPLSPAVCAAAGAIVFGGSAWLLVGAFRRRSGGASYRIKA
jgi:Na+-translocating ferredoxin:NAD+ oxidoreductase RnfD subunit